MSIELILILIHFSVGILFGPIFLKLLYKESWYNLSSDCDLNKEPEAILLFVIIFLWEFIICMELFAKLFKFYVKYHPSFYKQNKEK